MEGFLNWAKPPKLNQENNYLNHREQMRQNGKTSKLANNKSQTLSLDEFYQTFKDLEQILLKLLKTNK